MTASRYWTCPRIGCGHRNEWRGTSRKCQGCGKLTRRLKREPKHAHPLRHGPEHFAELNETVHGCARDECAICGKALRAGGQRDHAHFDGGYARGLLCWYCNRTLGLVERGSNGAEWMRRAMAYVERSASHHAAL